MAVNVVVKRANGMEKLFFLILMQQKEMIQIIMRFET